MKWYSGDKKRRKYSMKWQMMGILLLCWVIPFAFLIGALGFYLVSNHSDMTAENFKRQLEFNNKICVERLNAAVDASRQASYDGELLKTYEQYREGRLSEVAASRKCQSYLTDTYQKHDAVSSAVLWFCSEEQGLFSVYNERAGGTYQEIRSFERSDREAAQALAETLNTRIGFLYQNNALYLVRNLMDARYEAQAVLVLRLNQKYCFKSLMEYPSQEAVYLSLGQVAFFLNSNERLEEWIGKQNGMVPQDHGFETGNREGQDTGTGAALGSGYEWNRGRLFVTDRQSGNSYTVETAVLLQKEITPYPFYGYPYLLGGMLVVLIPMFLLMLQSFRRQVSRPLEALSEGARRIREGELGYQIPQIPENLEFAYLTDSMNSMSSHLKQQFDKIYQEEIALREARIMALQSHINPHFMNNTLEIINWEARLEGNVKVSKMIEALSTMLDAALDRRRRPVVRLAEEMGYVNSYLYITGERLGERLSVRIEIPEELMDYLVPRLILQPVVENAVEHGVVPKGSGTVVIRARRQEPYLILETENDGGLSPEDKEHIRRLLDPSYHTDGESSLNLGIANVNQRLRILYGEPCGLNVTGDKQGKVIARLTMLLQK